jgi:hypothetical protein
MSQVYSDPSRETETHSLPNVKTFYAEAGEWMAGEGFDEGPNEAGWYWWPCFPGCLPDGEANGPFDTEEEAIADAQDVYDWHQV